MGKTFLPLMMLLVWNFIAPIVVSAQFEPRESPKQNRTPASNSTEAVTPQSAAKTVPAEAPEPGRPAVHEHDFETGFRLQVAGVASGIVALFPVPQEWEDQRVELVEQRITPRGAKISMVSLAGATLAKVTIDRLAADEPAEVILRYRVRRLGVQIPSEHENFQILEPVKLRREARIYLGESPLIQSRDPRIARLAEELTQDEGSAWDKTKRIYEFVHQHLTYEEGPFKGAVSALEDRRGDCEEMTSLFVAISRAAGIPARTVWVPGHCYPEFLLAGKENREVWTAVEMTNDFPFGESPESRPILQKGDSFRVPGNRQPQHYVRPELKMRDYRGAAPPVVEWFPPLDKRTPLPNGPGR
ncbi:MAG: transglutaminase-like domain-containing protein [Pirellulaceae bacterium]